MKQAKSKTASDRVKPLDIDDPAAESDDSQFYVRMFKHDFGDPPWKKPAGKTALAIVLTSDKWGRDDEELGRILVRDLLQTICEQKEQPEALFLLNTAVKLGVKGAECLDFLQKLEALGVRIFVSKTSLYHFGVETELRVGEAVSMLELIGAMYRVEKLICL